MKDDVALYTVTTFANAMDVSARQVRRWIARGLLPVLRLGRRSIRISPADAETFLLSHREVRK